MAFFLFKLRRRSQTIFMNLEKALELISQKLNFWVSTVIKMLPNLLLASLILVVGIYLAKRVRDFARRKLEVHFHNRTLGDLVISLVYVVAIGIVIFTALRILNLDKTITTALAGAGIVGIALAFAFQDIAANFMSGIFLSFRRPFKIGEAIRIKDFEGFVEEIRLRDTTLKTYQGQLIIIPNREVFQNAIINFTRLGKRRADITGGVSKTADLRKVQQVALAALKEVPGVITDETHFLFENIGESTIDFKVLIWVSSGERMPYLQFYSDVIVHMTEAFRQNGIELPFPMRAIVSASRQP
ncbi:MAG: mechanosensitive ion channel family protein [Chryseobacterium sp.]|nr:MAG: mechanosensitive ion channel family protein [Chryseobacterium sp.]